MFAANALPKRAMRAKKCPYDDFMMRAHSASACLMAAFMN